MFRTATRFLFLSTLLAIASAAAAQTTKTFQGVPGTMTLVGSGKLTAGIKPNVTAPIQHVSKHHFTPGKPASKSSPGAPAASPLPLQSRKSGALVQSFEGVSSDLSQSFNFGIIVEPPDQGMCVGNLFGQPTVFEIVNLVNAAYTSTGTLFYAQDINSFFLETEPAFFGELVSDPRCLYDQSTDTFFFTVVATNYLTGVLPASFESHLDVAVLNGSTGFYNVYKFDTTDLGNVNGDCPCLDDQPHTGIDDNALYVAADEYSLTANLYNGAELFVISKSQLVAGIPANLAYFNNLTLDGIPVLTLMPAISFSPTGTEYLENSFPYDANGNNLSSANQIGLWTSTNDATVTTGGVPTLTATLVPTETYAYPVLAETPPPDPFPCLIAPFCGFLNPNDDRMGQVEFIDHDLWSAVSSAVNTGEVEQRDGAAWFRINTKNGKVTKQGYVAAAGQYLLYPTIMTTHNALTTVNFTITNSTLNPSAAFVVFPDKPEPRITIAAEGVDPYGSFAFRWGDYSWATLDPNGNNIWMANEYVPSNFPQSDFGLGPQPAANWGTWVMEK